MKQIAKKLVFGIAFLFVLPLAVVYKLSLIFLSNREHLFMSIGQYLALFPGKFGSYLRVAFYHQALPGFSKNTYVGFGSYFSHPEVEAGEGVCIGAYCIVGKALISQYVTIGSHVNILSGKRQHGFEEIGRPIQEQGGIFESVRIGENCWIGNGAIIMANVGKQCIVGAGAVVTSSSGDFEVLAGNPAKMIRRLTDRNKKDS